MINYNKIFGLESIYYFCEFDQIWKTEEWLNVVNYEGIYKVSDLGRIKSLGNNKTRKERILKPGIDSKGYCIVGLYKDRIRKTRKIHQLSTETFFNHVPCGMDLVINHKNFIRTDNRKLNLEIVTNRENSNQKHIKSTSKYTGVYFDKINIKWKSQIVINGKRKHLGRFINEIDAHNAYQEALKKLT